MKTKINIILALLVGTVIATWAAPTNNYYTAATLDGKNGRNLELALTDIISNFTHISYDDLWEKFEVTDRLPASMLYNAAYTDQVYDMYASWVEFPKYYSGNAIFPDALKHSQTGGFNREHAVPNSWWGGKSANNIAYSDLHHLTPADGAANNAKSNYPLGAYINGATLQWPTQTKSTTSGGITITYMRADNTADHSGSWSHVWKITTGTYGGGASYIWEPADQFKGDFARMYLYVVCAYEGQLTWETNYMFTSDSQRYTTIKPWALDLLLQWHRNDPVSQKERDRNDAIYGIQHNRNPFIDYPELVEYIWGNRSSQPFSLANAVSSYSDDYINGNTGGSGDTGGTGDSDYTDVTLVTNPNQLSTGDHVIVRLEDGSLGVTGAGSSTANASANPSEWVEYEVTIVDGGFTLRDINTRTYIATPTGNTFAYSTTAGTCTVSGTGALMCNSRTLCKNGNNNRFYSTINSSYDIFYVYLVPSIASYTVTFNPGSGACSTMSLTESSGGAGVTLPGVTIDSDTWSFAGWATASVMETDQRPTLYAEGDIYHPTGDCTLYAVYHMSESTGDANEYQVTTDLTPGTYVFGAVKAAASSSLANNTTIGAVTFSELASWGSYADLTPDDNGKITGTVPDEAVWTLSGNETDGYVLAKNGKYLYLKTSTGASSAGTATTEQRVGIENVSSTCKDAFLMHPSTSSTMRLLLNTQYGYRIYNTSTNATGQMCPYIRFYRRTSAIVDTYNTYPALGAPATLTSIAVTTQPAKTVYIVGETLDLTDLRVTAYYDDETQEDVTSLCTFSPEDGDVLSTVGEQTVTVTYNELTTTLTVTVNPRPTCAVTWSSDGTETTQTLDQGAALTLPDATTAVEGFEFMGWTTVDEVNADGTDIEYLSSGATVPALSAITYYAVFAHRDDLSQTITYGWEDNEPFADAFDNTFLNNNSSITAHGGSKYGGNVNASGNNVNGNNAKITTLNRYEATYVEFWYSKTSTNTTNQTWVLQTSTDGTNWTDMSPTYSASGATNGEWSKASWTLDGSSVYLRVTMGTTNNALRTIDDLVIRTGSLVLTDYTTRPSLTLRVDPVLAFEHPTYIALFDQPFEAPQPVTLSDGVISYGTSTTDVAHFADALTNEVTLNGHGYTLVTATQAESDTHSSGTAHYHLKVVPATLSVTTNGDGWATFAPSHDVLMPEADETFDIFYVTAVTVGGSPLNGKARAAGIGIALTGDAISAVADKTMAAGTGVIVRTDKAYTTVTFASSTVTDPYEIEGKDDLGSLLVGTLEPTTQQDNAYLLSKQGKDVGVSRWIDGSTLEANKCYLQLSATQGSEAPDFLLLSADGTTGVEDIATDALPASVYNMQGVKVLDAATSADLRRLPTGLYIHGTRKVVVR